MNSAIKNLCAVVMLLGSLALSVGCNTIEGAGRDLQKAGEAIQGAATR